MKALKKEMAEFYRRASRIYQERGCYADGVDAVWQTMDAFAAEHPDCAAVLLKAQLHEEIARQLEPVIFPHSPFFFEMNLRPAENWGAPSCGSIAGGWLIDRRSKSLAGDTQAAQDSKALADSIGFWLHGGGFDADHHSLNYTELLRVGVNGILRKIEESAARPGLSPSQQTFLEAAERSNRALIRIAERFADKAEELLGAEPDPPARRFLAMIAEAARRVPAEPPRTFYEGLAAAWFLREAAATMDRRHLSHRPPRSHPHQALSRRPCRRPPHRE